MDNCDVWADVDFGHGLVSVRCTETGKHEDHICHVRLVKETTTQMADNMPINRRNIFEGQKGFDVV